MTLQNRLSLVFALFFAIPLFIPLSGGNIQAQEYLRRDKLLEIDQAIQASIGRGEIPGAVLWIECKGEIYRHAYGLRMRHPHSERMTLDTIFDVASLTKVMATAPSILHLFEKGALHLDAPISKYIPEFLDGGVDDKASELVDASQRAEVTVLQLLTHHSGLPPSIYLSKGDYWGHEAGVERAIRIGLRDKPGSRFRYSDINYILLGEIVRRVSGQRLDSYAQDHLFDPLGMYDTQYQPPSYRHHRIAPTVFQAEFGLLRGVVHDPNARRMQGVAGHAGIFSTAADIAQFLRMYLMDGQVGGHTRILSPEIVDMATRRQSPAHLESKRGLGWDIHSPFSYQRGNAFPAHEGYGHTGWTGTSLWTDPRSQTFVILLTNRNHPNERAASVKNLRIQIGTLAGEAVGYTARPPQASSTLQNPNEPGVQTAADADQIVLNGIDVLERDQFSALAGLRLGLITNHTGVNRSRRSTIDLLATASNVELISLFSPEHGIRGTVQYESSVDDSKDRATGLPIYSLYKSNSKKPSAAQLANIDALVFDIQDIGCRFYTYISTMGLAMEAAAKAGKKFIVLDRVNPIGGVIVDGPIRKGSGNDFVAYHDIPIQHGMTTGELARMFNVERKINAELSVIPVSGWQPSMWFDQTGLPWINPSPNIRSLTEAILYPGVGLLEFTNISVGRGTSTPFEHIGAPWIHDGRLTDRIQSEGIPGLAARPTRFTPNASVYSQEDCGGVRFSITDREKFRPLSLGLALGRQLHAHHPSTYNLATKGNILLRDQDTLKAMQRGKSIADIRKSWEKDLGNFVKRRQKFLIYPR